MKNFDMKKARRSLRATVNGIEPAALDYVEWERFEDELEGVMQGGPNKPLVMAVFSRAANRARQAYHAAVVRGERFRPN